MGRPINKTWFGKVEKDGSQLTITAKLPNNDVGDGYNIAERSKEIHSKCRWNRRFSCSCRENRPK